MSRVATLQQSITRHIEHEDEPRQKPLDFRLISRLMEATRPYGRKRFRLLVVVVIRAIQLPALTWLLAAVIRGPIANKDSVGVLQGAFVFAALALSTQLIMHYRQRLALELGESVVTDLRNRLFRHIQRMPMRWFHTNRIGRVISRMTSDVEDIRIGVQEVFYVTLVQFIQMGIASTAMIWYDWSLFLIVLGLAPVIWLINRHFHRRLSTALRNMRESFSRVTATLVESVVGIRVTQGFVRQRENARIFEELSLDHSRYNSKVLKTHGKFLPLLELNSQIFMAVLLLVGGYRVLTPGYSTEIGDLVGFFFMANLFFSPISILGNQYNQAMTAMAGAERLYRLLDTEPEWVDAPNASPPDAVHGHVEFRNVTFGYDADRPVLHDITFTAKSGQVIALVGHTGSGKSSIINLICRFYLATRGEVLIDGRNIQQIAGNSLHRRMGIVQQQNFLFCDTVAENIRFARPESADADIIEVLKKLDCTDLLTSLPDGIQTRVGEGGASVSAGQRQLICFARAMLADPAILILDEATSSIDSATESRLQHALDVLLNGRTAFVVAHRLSTIRHADQVFVLEHGKIVERGTHDTLITQEGIYAGLYEHFAQH
ncbi:MAG: ABC transporter ATP-binding protein [Planctomycetota bacterium]|nr:ABC transporter ATP-binding protein [Planctomycetota bacterium]